MNGRTFIISKTEAEAIISVLKSNWIPLDLQKIVFELISRLEREIVS